MTMAGDGGLNRMSLADAIREHLKDRILSGQIAVGERITEQSVAKAMGTSSGPVREAFTKLSFEGLLTTLANRGTFVSTVSEAEARASYAIRNRLEPLAFELSRQRLTKELDSELGDIVGDLGTAAQARDFAAVIGLDLRFHGLVYQRSGNAILMSLWPVLENTARKFIGAAGPHVLDDLDGMVRTHEKLLRDFRANDLAAVAQELTDHDMDILANVAASKRTPVI